MRISVGIKNCDHMDITNSDTTETREYHLTNFTGDDPTEDAFILWARQRIGGLFPDRSVVTKYQVKDSIDGTDIGADDMWAQ